METFIKSAVAFVLLFGLCEAKVLDLGDSDFVSTLEQHDLSLVMFYAPWCGHCKKMKPEFEKAGKILAADDPPVQLAKVDCTGDGSATCNQHEVKGYPTLKIFRNGELSQEYNGPREEAGLIKYMRGMAGPASKELKSAEDLQKLLKKDDHQVLVLSTLSDSSDLEAFKKLASKMRETCAFAHLVGGETGGRAKDSVTLIRPGRLASKLEDQEVAYKGGQKFVANDVEKWIKDNFHGLAGHRTRDNAGDFGHDLETRPLVTVYYEVDYVRNAKGTNYWRNRVLKVAKKWPSFRFAVSDVNDFQYEVEEFGLKALSKGEVDKPQVAIKSAKGKFPLKDRDFSVEALEDFLKDFEAGKLEAHVKSEPLPEDNSGPVKVAVGKNFDQLVMANEKDVLVEFYAPWCGHCKKLSPIYDELGQAMAEEDVEIVKIDATANDSPPIFEVRGFPTIFWLPAKSKKPVAYNGGRELDDFVKFIAQNAEKELKGYDRSGKKKKAKEEL